MPIYEYQCSHCGHELELMQKFSDAPATHCPECGTENLKKKISAAGFRLAGGGWYETDFKSGKKKNLAGDADAGKSDASKGTKDSGSSAKPEKKSSDSSASKAS